MANPRQNNPSPTPPDERHAAANRTEHSPGHSPRTLEEQLEAEMRGPQRRSPSPTPPSERHATRGPFAHPNQRRLELQGHLPPYTAPVNPTEPFRINYSLSRSNTGPTFVVQREPTSNRKQTTERLAGPMPVSGAAADRPKRNNTRSPSEEGASAPEEGIHSSSDKHPVQVTGSSDEEESGALKYSSPADNSGESSKRSYLSLDDKVNDILNGEWFHGLISCEVSEERLKAAIRNRLENGRSLDVDEEYDALLDEVLQ